MSQGSIENTRKIHEDLCRRWWEQDDGQASQAELEHAQYIGTTPAALHVSYAIELNRINI